MLKDNQQKILNDELREQYLMLYPKHEMDLEIYSAKYAKGQKIVEIAEELYISVSTVYRNIKRVKDFLEKEVQIIPLYKLRWVVPRGFLMRGVNPNVEDKLARVCIILYQQTKKMEVPAYYVRELNRLYPGMKNKKRKLFTIFQMPCCGILTQKSV